MRANFTNPRRSRFLWVAGGAHLLSFTLVLPMCCHGADPVAPALHIALAYNASIFADDKLQRSTEAILGSGMKVEVTLLPYVRPSEFRMIYRDNVLSSTSHWDLVLGPTESAALKALNDSFETQQPIPFLAPFITTSPKDYRNLTLIPGAPGDDERVRTAVLEFVQHTASRTLAVLHSDDLWGHSIVKCFRQNLGTKEVVVHSQPVEEFSEDSDEDENVVADNSQLYRTFLQKMRTHGATIIGVALLTAEASNQFLEALHQLNGELLVTYKPTILFLSQPGFAAERSSDGVLYRYLNEFDVFYVADCLTKNGARATQIDVSLASHLDACRVIAAAANVSLSTARSATWQSDAVKLVLAFYKGMEEADKLRSINQSLLTAYHARKLHYDQRELEVRQATVFNGQLKERAISDYFENGRLRQVLYSGWFFMLHHRVLWNYWTVLLFAAVAFVSFYHVIQLKSERPTWMLLKTQPFWGLFLLNIGLTYLVWILSINFGVFGDSNLGAALALAAACPTAASALGDIARRYLPFDMSGIVSIIEALNRKLIASIGNDQLEQFKVRLQQLSVDGVKNLFFDVLFLKVTNDDLRNRVHAQLQKGLAQSKASLATMKQEGLDEAAVQENEKRQEQKVYAESLITALGYLSSSERDLRERMDRLLNGTVAPAIN
jgi:hypothetical protein